MRNITANKLLDYTVHRPYPLPKKDWHIYQEWHKVVFLHWVVDKGLIQPYVPEGLYLDTYKGQAWVSLVAFTIQEFRSRYLFPLPYFSNFHEVNLRTYITDGERPGIYFFSLEADKLVHVIGAKSFTGLNYFKADITRTNSVENEYKLENKNQSNYLDLKYEVGNKLDLVTDLDKWLLERYCLYHKKRDKTFRLDIHHLPWQLRELNITKAELKYKAGIQLLKPSTINLSHFSEGVKVLLWPREYI